MPTSVRPYRLGDEDAIRQLAEQLGYPSTFDDVTERLATIAGDTRSVVLVCELDGDVVGWIHVARVHNVQDGTFAEITGAVVADQHRGVGIGEQLLDTAEAWAVEQACETVRVRSNIVRARAHGFYRDRGYRVEKEQAVFIKGL
jgi:ribosomal protein S18 acetylase RimI-like enzyme